jgi:hypothetical protein
MPDVTPAIEQLEGLVKSLDPHDMALFVSDARTVFDTADVPAHPDEISTEQFAKLLASVDALMRVIRQWTVSAALSTDLGVERQIQTAVKEQAAGTAPMTALDDVRSLLAG